MLLASRDIKGAMQWVADNKDDENISKTMEKAKAKYAGTEISQTEVISYVLTNTEVGNWMLASLKAGKFGIVLSASYNPPISDFVQHAFNIYNIDIFIFIFI